MRWAQRGVPARRQRPWVSLPSGAAAAPRLFLPKQISRPPPSRSPRRGGRQPTARESPSPSPRGWLIVPQFTGSRGSGPRRRCPRVAPRRRRRGAPGRAEDAVAGGPRPARGRDERRRGGRASAAAPGERRPGGAAPAAAAARGARAERGAGRTRPETRRERAAPPPAAVLGAVNHALPSRC